MRKTWLAALAVSAGLCSISFGEITGKVTLKGTPPQMAEITAVKQVPQCAQMHKDPIFEETVLTDDKGGLQNVVVSIKTPQGKTLKSTAPAKTEELDQKGCVYVPHVIAVMTNQPMVAKNSDPFLHNVHTLSLDNDAVNFGMPTVGTHKMGPFKEVETFKVKCDVHPWMAAWIRVVDNPFFAVTDEHGSYKLDTAGLPDGEYDLVFWQEKYGEKTEKVNVKGGKAEANFSYDAGGKAEAPAFKEVHLASLLQKADSEKCDSCCGEPTEKKATAAVAAK